MANVKKVYVFATSCISGIAVLFTIISLATEEWIVTYSAKYTDISMSDSPHVIKYGLFQGTHKMEYPSTLTLQLTMTCLESKNICAMLCANNADDRYTILKKIYNNEAVDQNPSQCPSVRTKVSYINKPLPTLRSTDGANKKYINCGIWVSTVVFLSISLAFGTLATVLSISNTVFSPVEIYLSLFGIYIYNSIACCCTVLSMSLWGVMHLVITYYDVGIFETLVGRVTSEKAAQLGYSFWILLIPTFFYFGSICVLYIRQYLISKDPGQKIVQRDEAADPVIYLY